MDSKRMKEKLISFLKQYRYVALVILLGLVLMAIPDADAEPEADPVTVQAAETVDPEQRLEKILGQIEGVGKVQVLLTEAEGVRTRYIYNEDSTSDAIRSEAVIITDGDRAQQGLVEQVIPPTYQGAIIVCQGGDRASVQLAIVEAVSDVTGLSADKITVLKMK